MLQDKQSKATYMVLDVAKKEITCKFVKKKAKNISIPATIKEKGVTYKVTGIGKNVFKGNKKVRKITLSSNVKTIGKMAFYGCKNLKTIIIKSTKLTSKTVSKNAFKGISKETIVKVPKKKWKTYKKLFRSKGLSSKVKVKKY